MRGKALGVKERRQAQNLGALALRLGLLALPSIGRGEDRMSVEHTADNIEHGNENWPTVKKQTVLYDGYPHVLGPPEKAAPAPGGALAPPHE